MITRARHSHPTIHRFCVEVHRSFQAFGASPVFCVNQFLTSYEVIFRLGATFPITRINDMEPRGLAFWRLTPLNGSFKWRRPPPILRSLILLRSARSICTHPRFLLKSYPVRATMDLNLVKEDSFVGQRYRLTDRETGRIVGRMSLVTPIDGPTESWQASVYVQAEGGRGVVTKSIGEYVDFVTASRAMKREVISREDRDSSKVVDAPKATDLVNPVVDDRGQDVVEYALVLALVALAGVAGFQGLAGMIDVAFGAVSSTLGSAFL